MNAIIEELRTARERGQRPSAPGANLRSANLWGANLVAADLVAADLLAADLVAADLLGANLAGANLAGANLAGANLRGANLLGANLWGANRWGGLPIQAGASGSGHLIPTPEGWRITIGCWRGRTLDDLRDLIEDRAKWPEAEGAERERRRPMLRAVLALCEAHIGQHEGLIEQLAERWAS